MALLSGGTRTALTSTPFLPRAPRFLTAYFLLNQHDTNVKIASQTRYDMSPDIPWSSAWRQLRSFRHKWSTPRDVDSLRRGVAALVSTSLSRARCRFVCFVRQPTSGALAGGPSWPASVGDHPAPALPCCR